MTDEYLAIHEKRAMKERNWDDLPEFEGDNEIYEEEEPCVES